MQTIIVPKGYEKAVQEIIQAVSIPVTEETFSATLASLVEAVQRGAKDGLTINACTFGKEGITEQPVFMGDAQHIENCLKQDGTAVLLSDKNGAVFCLTHITVGDRSYIQFMNPDAARTIAQAEQTMLKNIQVPEELTFFQWLCNMLSELILRHPTEPAARREAYRNFYENMQKNAEQLEQLTQSRTAGEYDPARRQRILEEEAAKQRERELEEKRRQEELEKQANEEKKEEQIDPAELQRQQNIEYWTLQLNNRKTELSQLPGKIENCSATIETNNTTINNMSKLLGPNQLQESKLLEKINELKSNMETDRLLAKSLQGQIDVLDIQKQQEHNALEEAREPLDKYKNELQLAKDNVDRIYATWDAVEEENRLMQMEPKAYLEYNYQLSKQNREQKYNDDLKNLNIELGQRDAECNSFNLQIKQLNKKKDAQKIADLKQKRDIADNARKELQQKITNVKRNFDIMEKAHRLEFLSPTTEKLNEIADFLKAGRYRYLDKQGERESAENVLRDMTQTYQQMALEYEQKEEAFNQKWEKLNNEKTDLQTQFNTVKERETQNQQALEKLQTPYNELKRQNEEALKALKLAEEQQTHLKEELEKYKEKQTQLRESLDEAKNELRKLDVPVADDEPEKENIAAPVNQK